MRVGAKASINKAIRPNLDVTGTAQLPNQLQVRPAASVAKEHLPPAASLLCQLAQQARCDNTSNSNRDGRDPVHDRPSTI
jgi:hypothetical protein